MNKLKQRGFSVTELLAVVVAILAIWGWGWNIVKIADNNFHDITGLLILRIVGIFVAPLGCILGFL